MKQLPFIISLLLVFAAAQFVSAGETSFIKIDSPENEDSYYEYDTDKINLVSETFSGSVSSDCVSIRALWSPDSDEAIQDYLDNGSKKKADVVIDDYYLKKFSAGDKKFIYNVSGKLTNLHFGTNYYRFIAKFKDGSSDTYKLTWYVYYGGMGEKAKPVIYLYPTKKQTVTVSVKPEGGVTESIPEMGKEWKVTATPDGTLTDAKTKKTFPYLFWESADNGSKINTSEGFVVATDNLTSFFEEKLAVLGLNKKEIADFTEYWIPELKKDGKAYEFITFYSEDRINKEAPLSVSPAPDSIIRVYFDHMALDAPIETKEQTLTSKTRTGFAVVEWGGKRYSK